ncbi:hypothetical protein [Bernardetia sp.]|uniref:hypothetical protein n=1 Tax=Bernardetia sp. TaxID=1937974 RepID=UPI0025C28704|nr:hypothetical protein [Bernardetia sp.]
MESKISVTDLHKIIKEIATELDWHTHVFAEGTYAQTHPPFWSGSWGEDIIVLSDKKNELVLVNSICSLQKRSSVFAFGRNRKNEQRLIKKIKEYEANQLR